MRKLGLVVTGLLCAAGLLTMQASVAAKAKTVKDDVTIATDLKVGTTVLKPGSYRVESDGSKITFQHLQRSIDGYEQLVDKKAQPVTVPCTTKPLDKKSASTSLDTQADTAGGTVLKGVQIRGSEVAFTVSN